LRPTPKIASCTDLWVWGLGDFFDKETWGSDRLVIGSDFNAEFPAKSPLSTQAKLDTLRLYDRGQPDYMPGLSSAEKKLGLARMSYQDFLLNHAKVDKQVLWFVQASSKSFFQVGADAVPAPFSWHMD
jgi:spermidine dehydrogenase